MRLVYFTGSGSRDIDVRSLRSDATVSDLARALGPAVDDGPEGEGALFVDDVKVPGERTFREAGLHEGAAVSAELADDDRHEWAYPGELTMCILTGEESGRRIPLAPGTVWVGRSSECQVVLSDRTVSRVHCQIEIGDAGDITVTNHSGHVGTEIGGSAISEPTAVEPDRIVALGYVLFCFRVEPDDRPAGVDRYRDVTAAGTINLNRPPRMLTSEPALRIDPPVQPVETSKAPFSVAALVSPLVMAGVMAVALHNLLYAMFALLSPVMLLGNRFEASHRSTRGLRRATRDYQGQVESFSDAVRIAHRREGTARRRDAPDLPEIVRRAALPSTHIWERRGDHPDFLQLTAGFTHEGWSPPLKATNEPIGAEAQSVLDQLAEQRDVPSPIDLCEGGVVGLVGDRFYALGVARSLLSQASVLHGPADLRIVVVTASDTQHHWDFAKWLPHTREANSPTGDHRLIAVGSGATGELLNSLLGTEDEKGSARPGGALHVTLDPRRPKGPTTLYMIDGDELLAGQASPARQLLRGDGGPACGIVIAPTADRLPAVCTQVITLDPLGSGELVDLRHGNAESTVVVSSLPGPRARNCALALARFEDPEVASRSARLPDSVQLGTLLGIENIDARTITERWERNQGDNHLRSTVGSAETGPFVLDFDRHGPHGLIGGTTGSGKSELLKTLVASLAAEYPPSELTFGLFDFKGGSTFTEFATMPHTVGMANDLDVNLAKRALRCLRAELLHRERVFDEVGAKDLTELNERRRLGHETANAVERVPRLVVIIDEFAAMAKELAEEIGALADLTARGRSLGVHLLLATQKPSTSVNAEIKTNTRLRISLMVEDKQDSMDVIGIPDAASVNHKGRGYFRVGQGEVVPIQTALSTAPAGRGGGPAVEVRDFTIDAAPVEPAPKRPGDGPTDLNVLVASIKEAFSNSGATPPRRPWPDPLPDRLSLDDLAQFPPATGRPEGELHFALADDPEGQTRYPVGWPLRRGNLLLYGVVGSGTTTALSSIALEFARRSGPDRVHLYVFDFGAGELLSLAGLPHCAAAVGSADSERQMKVLRRLSDELRRRRALSVAERSAEPLLVFMIDNFEGFRSAYEATAWSAKYFDQFLRIYADGPEVGIVTALSASRVGGVPAAVSSSTSNKILFRLADLADFGSVGLSRRQLPTFVPGRAVTVDGQVLQVALPPVPLAEAAQIVQTAVAEAARIPRPVAELSADVLRADLAGQSAVGDSKWDLAVGVRDEDFAPAQLVMYDGEGGLVIGPARSGKSTTLLTVAASFRDAAPGAPVLGVACRRSPLQESPLLDRIVTDVDAIPDLIDQALLESGPVLVLMDDVDLLDDPSGRLAQLAASGRAGLRIVGAGRNDRLRGQYGHWTQKLRSSRVGVLLQPNLDFDGELLGVKLPSRVQVAMPPGRGFLAVEGDVELIQVAH